MTTQGYAIYTSIEQLFGTLSGQDKVSLMTSLYYQMSDLEKDKFLEETENA